MLFDSLSFAISYDTLTYTKWYVNDPGFEMDWYSYEDIVGYRVFKMIFA
jgi:hypothetical protein